MSNFIESLKWRYAVKKFDPTKEISSEQLQTLMNAARLSASSYGLQPYTILVIKDRELREKLVMHSFNQRQVADSSYLFVFCANTNVNNGYIDHYVDLVADERGMERSQLKDFENAMKGSLGTLDENSKLNWASRQAYIALGNLLAAAAHMQIDSCPMEGFNKAQYDEVLGLNDKGLKSLVLLPVGYRAEDDAFQHLKKVRFHEEELFVKM